MEQWTPEQEARHTADQEAADARATMWLKRIVIVIGIVLLFWIAVVVISFGGK